MSTERTSQEIIDSAFSTLSKYGETGAIHVAMTALETLKSYHERKPVQVVSSKDIVKVEEHPLTQQQLSDIEQAGDIIANLPAKNSFEKSSLHAAKNAMQGTLKRLNPKQVFCIIDPTSGQYIREKPISKEQEEIEKLKAQIEELKKSKVDSNKETSKETIKEVAKEVTKDNVKDNVKDKEKK